MKIVEYNYEDIQKIVNVLNTITVVGTDSCRAIAQIADLIETGRVKNFIEKEANDDGLTEAVTIPGKTIRLPVRP